MRLLSLVLIGLLVVLPPLRSLLESTMLTHMLVQIPVLAGVGWGLGQHASWRWPQLMQSMRPFRWALLVVASSTFLIWMVPRLLDMVVESPFVDATKVLSLIFGGGMALHLAWCHLGPVARGLFQIEALASFWRLGWIYLESPVRLCTRYGLDDQYQLGRWLITTGVCYALWLGWRALLGPSISVLKRETI